LIADRYAHIPRRGPAGSIIALVATDAPLTHRQLTRLSRRAALALGRTGGYASNNSGEIILSWSTANRIPRLGARRRYRAELVLDAEIDPLFEATLDAVEEAILNAICAGIDMPGHSGHRAPALPLDLVAELLARFRPPHPADPPPGG